MNYAKKLDQQLVKPEQEDNKVKLYYGMVSANVVDNILAEYHSRVNYSCRRVDVDTSFVFRKEYKCYTKNELSCSEFMGYIIPKFSCVRIVKIVERVIRTNISHAVVDSLKDSGGAAIIATKSEDQPLHLKAVL